MSVVLDNDEQNTALFLKEFTAFWGNRQMVDWITVWRMPWLRYAYGHSKAEEGAEIKLWNEEAFLSELRHDQSWVSGLTGRDFLMEEAECISQGEDH